jgi:hypothetical protein
MSLYLADRTNVNPYLYAIAFKGSFFITFFRTVSLILTRNPNVILRNADDLQLIIMQLLKDLNFSLFQKYGMIIILSNNTQISNVELKFVKYALFIVF